MKIEITALEDEGENPSKSRVEIDSTYQVPSRWNPKCFLDSTCTERAEHLIVFNGPDFQAYSTCETHVAETLLSFLHPVDIC